MPAKKENKRWLYSIIPIAATASGISIIIPLYILLLGGTILDVGIALAVFSLVSVPSSVLWGKLTDDIGRLKYFIIFSILGTFPVLGALLLLHTISSVILAFGFYAFVSSSSSPSLNLFIMGKRKDMLLARYLSEYNILFFIGFFMAMVPGALINESNLKYYIMFLLFANVIALLIAFVFIEEEEEIEAKKNRTGMQGLFPIIKTVRNVQHSFISHSLIERLQLITRNKRRINAYLLMLSIFLFNLGLYLFNTAYIPFLVNNSIGYNNVFIINVADGVGEIGIFLAIIYIAKGIDLHRYYHASSILRAAAMAFIMLPLFVHGIGVSVLDNLAGYAVAGTAAALWSISSYVLVYEMIRDAKEGKAGFYIGLFIAVIGASSFLGSLLAGAVSASSGYGATFIFAIIVTLASSFVLVVEKRY